MNEPKELKDYSDAELAKEIERRRGERYRQRAEECVHCGEPIWNSGPFSEFTPDWRHANGLQNCVADVATPKDKPAYEYEFRPVTPGRDV
jgi:hypothetical protein